MCVWYVEARVERDAVVSHYVFAKLGPRLGDFRASPWKIPYFGTLAVETGAYLVLRDVSRAGRGGGVPRIAHSRECPLDAAISRRRLKKSLF